MSLHTRIKIFQFRDGIFPDPLLFPKVGFPFHPLPQRQRRIESKLHHTHAFGCYEPVVVVIHYAVTRFKLRTSDTVTWSEDHRSMIGALDGPVNSKGDLDNGVKGRPA